MVSFEKIDASDVPQTTTNTVSDRGRDCDEIMTAILSEKNPEKAAIKITLRSGKLPVCTGAASTHRLKRVSERENITTEYEFANRWEKLLVTGDVDGEKVEQFTGYIRVVKATS